MTLPEKTAKTVDATVTGHRLSGSWVLAIWVERASMSIWNLHNGGVPVESRFKAAPGKLNADPFDLGKHVMTPMASGDGSHMMFAR